MPQPLPSSAGAATNGVNPKPTPPSQLVFALPSSPDTNIHLHITDLSHSTTVFLASSTTGAPPTGASCGSFVYALPARTPTAQPLSSALYNRASSLDFATRLAKILAKKLAKPVYVGGEVSFWAQEDESMAMRGCVDVVVKVVDEATPVG